MVESQFTAQTGSHEMIPMDHLRGKYFSKKDYYNGHLGQSVLIFDLQ